MMLIIPLPHLLLNLLIAANLLLSLLMLLLVLCSALASNFSFFPTILLILTVFGLGLNVFSARLILSQGSQFNGQMIKAFVSFFGSSSSSAGMFISFGIFSILITVLIFVITKGATRAAEAAARFMLDAMPMKQIIIKAEYSSGAITEEESNPRKLEVQREADFYGALDGAAKIISLNVKIGVFITAASLAVGLIFGMVLRGESFNQAIGPAGLTISVGILSQLPALFVSLASGIIIIRSTSGGTLGNIFR